MANPVIILGTKDLGKVALNIFKANNMVVYSFLDDDKKLWGQEINHVPVLGSTMEERYIELLEEQCDAFIAITQPARRQQLAAMLYEQKQVRPINAIHPSARIATSATLGHGNLVNAGVSLGIDTILGNGCILHTRATIEHDTVIKDFVQLGAASVVGTGATLHDKVFVGVGATIVTGVEIGSGASIGAGSVVLANVKPGETVLGNPAKPIKV